jgi:hypothetical protein
MSSIDGICAGECPLNKEAVDARSHQMAIHLLRGLCSSEGFDGRVRFLRCLESTLRGSVACPDEDPHIDVYEQWEFVV